ncbi:hypothetical protein EBU24_02515 [bacterium]|jgi:hypothetical protein|nr:hypothetical protein [bacterium]
MGDNGITDNEIKADEIQLVEKPHLNEIKEVLETTVDDIKPPKSPEILPKILSRITDLLFLNYDSIKSSLMYNILVALLWMFFSVGIYTISFGIQASHVVFTIYCCSVWLMALAIIFLFNLKNKI